MYFINKIVGALISPLGLAMVALAAAVAWSAWRGGRRILSVTALVVVIWLWVWGMKAWSLVVGMPLERGWTCLKAEDAPSADAIVVLGGGMSAAPGAYPYPDMHSAADRVWHAARLYRAGKAPIVIPSGAGDRESVVPLLVDFGVPTEAVVGEYQARNTEENALFVQELLRRRRNDGGKLRILLVTSAWHMRRSLLMYRRYAPDLEIVPAPADFENTVLCARFELRHLVPSAEDFYRNSCMVKELVGYWGYRLLRR